MVPERDRDHKPIFTNPRTVSLHVIQQKLEATNVDADAGPGPGVGPSLATELRASFIDYLYMYMVN